MTNELASSRVKGKARYSLARAEEVEDLGADGRRDIVVALGDSVEEASSD
jgi:hypothetical protein